VFTGIVEERGLVRDLDRRRLVVTARKVLEDSGPGSSLSVNGVCLTVVSVTASAEGEPGGTLAFDVSPETLARTSLGSLGPGDPVNLERPVTLLSRLGGHLVQGHVDGVGTVAAVEEAELGKVMEVELPQQLAPYVAEKGSIAVDGVSLTVTRTHDGRFGVALVPFTLEATTLGARRAGDRVNLEVDVMAKYVEGLLRGRG
jgi:riboflavin synthase